MSLETFRGRLARVNKVGHLEAVRALLKDAGYAKVSDVEPEDYEELVRRAEALL
jgi:predicted LPLAT superfamily acyltransferase